MKNLFLTIVLASVFCSTTSYSKDLTLDEVLTMSRTYWSGRLGISQVQAEASASLAKSQFLPNVNAGLNINKAYMVDPSQDLQGSAQVTLDQQLVDVSDFITLGATKAEAISQACQTEEDQIQVGRAVIASFFSALGNMDEDRLQTKRSSKIQRAVDLLSETTKLRLSSQSDLYQAQTQAYQIEIQKAQVSAAKVAALNDLRTQLGISPKDPITLESKFVQQDTDITDWVQWPENVPSVVVLKGRVSAANKEVAATQWELFPAVGASIVYNDPITGIPGDDDSLSVLGTVNVPLFDGYSRQIRTRRNKKLLRIYENLLQNRKVDVANDLAALIVQKKADLIALEQAKKQMDISEKAYKGAWTLLSLGKNDFFYVQNTQDVAINAERQWLQISRRLDATNATLKLYSDAVSRIKTNKYACRTIPN